MQLLRDTLKLVFLLVFHCAAQMASATSETVVWATGTLRGTSLQWTVPTDRILAQNYSIFRSAAGKNRFSLVGRVSRLSENELRTIPLPCSKDSLVSLLSTASSERVSGFVRYQALKELKTIALLYPEPLLLVLGLSFTDTSCRINASYEYRIQTGENPVCTSSSVVAGLVNSPLLPHSISVKPDQYSVHFSWSTDSALTKGLRGCNVYRWNESTYEFVKITARPAVSIHRARSSYTFSFFDDIGLTPGIQQKYYLTAVDVFGREGQRSAVINTVPVDIRKYKAPRITSTVIGDGKVTVRWQAENDPDRRGFNLYRGALGYGDHFRVNEQILAPNIYSYTDFLNDASADHVAYAVSSVDKGGLESRLSYDVQVPIIDHTPPMSSDFFQCVRSLGVARLSWSQSPSVDAKQYELERGISPIGPFEPVFSSDHENSFVDSIQSYSTSSLWYRMRVVDRHGNTSTWSEAVQAYSSSMQTITAPTPIAVHSDLHSKVIDWFPSHSAMVHGYIVNRYDDSTGVPQTITQVALDASQSQYIDEHIDLGKTYWYEIVCVGADGDFSLPSAKVRSSAQSLGTKTRAVIKSINRRDNKTYVSWSGEGPVRVDTRLCLEKSYDGKDFVEVSSAMMRNHPILVDSSDRNSATVFYRIRTIDPQQNASEFSPLQRLR